MKYFFCLICLFTFQSISLAQYAVQLIDNAATKETNSLYSNLKAISQQHVLFGHQHATEYGHGWSGDKNRSDVKSVTGSHPP